MPVSTHDEIDAVLSELRTKYHDARHHCYAWRLGVSGDEMRANDDGEPRHSAGDPILGQIISGNYTNVIVVVVRYFGGTKLGVGGLINAYKTAAKESLSKAKTQPVIPMVDIHLSFTYEATRSIERALKAVSIQNIRRQYGSDCHLYAQIPREQLEEVKRIATGLAGVELQDPE